MMREWKSGDVAEVTITRRDGSDGPNRYTAFYAGSYGWYGVLRDELRGVGGITDNENVFHIARRPLVVIDPEDREQVERLHEAFNGTGWAMGPVFTDRLQAALRSLIEPTKPPEPTGLGAVVEDADGLYVHFGNGCWIKAVPNASLRQKDWGDFTAAVRVLDEGWSE